jgi:hypothetical protein
MSKTVHIDLPQHKSLKIPKAKGVTRIHISKKNRQHNGQKKKYERTNNDLQNMHIKLKIE